MDEKPQSALQKNSDSNHNSLECLVLRREYIDATAHEIRTPLAVISSSAELIALSSRSEVQDLEAAKKELVGLSMQLGRVVSNTVDAERFVIGATGLAEQKTNAADLFLLVTSNIQKRFRTAKVNTRVSDSAKDALLHCDRERVAHALACCLSAFDKVVKADVQVDLFLELVRLQVDEVDKEAYIQIGFEIKASQSLCQLVLEALSTSVENASAIIFRDLSDYSKSIVALSLELSLAKSIAALHSGEMHMVLLEPSVARVWISLPSESSLAATCLTGRSDKQALPLGLLLQYTRETLQSIDEQSALLSAAETTSGNGPAKQLMRIKSNARSLLEMLEHLVDNEDASQA